MKNIKKALNKPQIKNCIEPFLYEQLPDSEFSVSTIPAKKLLTWNRLDLAFKLFYLELKNQLHEMADTLYEWDIQAQTSGKFSELGNVEKNTFSDYKNLFDVTFNNIAENGFQQDESLIPVARDGSIYNGAHRTSSAILLEKSVTIVELDLPPMICDYRFYYERKVPEQVLEMVVNKFIEFSDDNVYLAFLWPSGKVRRKEAESLFPNVIYRKEITPSHKGAFNLLANLYEGMDWVGEKEDGYPGVNQKLIECFPTLQAYTVVAFQANSLAEVREIKEKVRAIYNIGFSSVHITDTKEEAVNISNLLFNENGLHFLEHATPYKYTKIYNEFDEFSHFLAENDIFKKDVLIDGSTTLALYGIRKNSDLDFVIGDPTKIKEVSIEFDPNGNQLEYHRHSKLELIYNPQNSFIFYGYKFVSFKELHSMKKNRNADRDINDCSMMEAFISNKKMDQFIASLKQKWLYNKIRFTRFRVQLLMKVLKKTGLYIPVKKAYYYLKSQKK